MVSRGEGVTEQWDSGWSEGGIILWPMEYLAHSVMMS